MVWSRLRAEEVNMTPHQTCLEVRWRLGSAPNHFSPSFCSFGPHWMFVGCQIESCSITEDRRGTGAPIYADGEGKEGAKG